MKIVASIEARMNSKRLYGKVLKEVCGKPVLWHIVERINRSKYVQDVVIATSTSGKDDAIIKFADKYNIMTYRGSEDDVLKRLVETHEYMNSDLVVEITGDSPFVDCDVIDQTIEMYLSSNCDYVSNTLTRTYPIGVRSQVFHIDLLKECDKLSTEKKDREHVTTYICRNEEGKYKLKNLLSPDIFNIPKLRLSLDYEEDFILTKKVYEALYPKNKEFKLNDIISFLDKRPDIVEINKHCKQEYKAGA